MLDRTLTARIHAAEHLAELLRLDTAGGRELTTPLQDEQQTRLLATLVLAACALRPPFWLILQLNLPVAEKKR